MMKPGTKNLLKKLIKQVLFTSESATQLMDFKAYFEEETLIHNIPTRVFYKMVDEAVIEILEDPAQ